ncbi:MAG: PilZ domain-containing protein [Thermodesulfobacteriota bacterium]
MSSKRVISAKQVAADVRSGLSDEELMKKYTLTPKDLTVVMNKLMNSGLIGFEDLQRREVPFEEEETFVPPSEFRRWERYEVEFPLRVYEKSNRAVQGTVMNISERGIGIRGIRASVGEMKTLVLRADEVFQMGPIVCEAVCRWIAPSREDRHCTGGYEVIEFLEGNLMTLQHLMKALTLEERIALKERHQT